MTEMEVSKGEQELEEVKRRFEARVQSAVDEAMTRAEEAERLEIAEPYNWWNLYAVGVYQPPGYLQPGNLIRVGEVAYVYSILWLNPLYPQPISACNLVSNLACEFEVKYCAGDFCSWTPGPASLNVTHTVKMASNRCWYVDVLRIYAQQGMEGCYELNICAKIKGCAEGAAPPFAAFATRVFDVNPDYFYPYGPGVGSRYEFDIPLRFMIYE